MLLKEFKYEDKHTKKELLSRCGVYLAQRPQDDSLVLLFQIDAFYVEVFYDAEEQEVGYMRAFTSLDELDIYLRQIDITALMNLSCSTGNY
jgi:hypothetical protein